MEKNFDSIIDYSLILTILFFIIGIVLIFFPQVTMTSISHVMSFCFITLGAILVFYSSKEILFMNFLSFGVLQIIIGFIMLVYPNILTTLVPICIGVWMILKSTVDFKYSLLLKKGKVKEWFYVSIMSILSIICGIMLIVKTEIGAFSPMVVLGLFLTANCLSAILDVYIFKDNARTLVTQIKKCIKI